MAPIIRPPRKGYDVDTSVLLGRGRNANVYECHCEDGKRYAMKIHVEGRRSNDKIKREIKILKHLRHPNIVAFVDTARGEGVQEGARAIVLECVEHIDFRTLFPRLGDVDVRFYMWELAKALVFAHAYGVMHRDVRPHNVLIDYENRRLVLSGWGSADFYEREREYTSRVGIFKPPELLLDVRKYDMQVDMWCFGSMLASMVFRTEPFFMGNSLQDQLVKIARVLGTDGLYEYCSDIGLELDEEDAHAVGRHPALDLASFVTPENQHLVSDEALDLLRGLLKWDPKHRLTSRDALRHPYFTRLPSLVSTSTTEETIQDEVDSQTSTE